MKAWCYILPTWMVKVKSDRYKLVKAMRPLMQRVLLRGRSFNKSGDIADLARRIIDYAHEHHIDLPTSGRHSASAISI